MFEACKYVFRERPILSITGTVGEPALVEVDNTCETRSLGTDSAKLYSA